MLVALEKNQALVKRSGYVKAFKLNYLKVGRSYVVVEFEMTEQPD
jgi:hypothetical protein